ncbi:Cyclin T [Carabus blaptoides fortunei]
MAADEKWYFTKEQLQNTPSRRCGFDADKELSYRQQAANFIQDMGQKLQVSQLCINTAIVYMHRFYMFHSFTHFPWNTIAAASFFLAAKVEEQPRKLEHVIRVANHCLHRDQATTFDAKSEQYAAQSQDLVFNENVLLQTLGFDVAIDHPHTHVVRCCHLVRASKDLAQTSYFMASNSLHLTTMCLQYKPTVVACFCIHLACKWSNWQIPKSNEGKDWFFYVDKSVTSELLEQLTSEFLKIFDKCPSRLKRKISSISTINQNHTGASGSSGIDQLHAASSNSPFDPDSRKLHNLDKDGGPTFHPRTHHDAKPGLLATPEDPHKKPQRPHDSSSSQQQQQQPRPDYREYREKKERERLEREKAQHHGKPTVQPVPGGKHMAPSSVPPAKPTHSSSSHHRPPVGVDPNKMKMHQHRPTDPAAMGHSRDHSKELTNGRDSAPHSRERDHRDAQKREYMSSKVDGSVSASVDSLTGGVKVDSGSGDKRYDSSNRQKVVDPNKIQLKQHDPNRHRSRELDPKYQKRPEMQCSSGNSVPLNSGVDKKTAQMQQLQAQSGNSDKQQQLQNSNFTSSSSSNSSSKQNNSTSQRHRSPFSDASKSVLVPTSVAVHPPIKTEMRSNGNHHHSNTSAATHAPPSALTADERNSKQLWPADSQQTLDEPGLLSPPPPKKTSSLFSPEKTPPHKKSSWNTKTPPSSGKRTTDTPQLPTTNAIPPPISPFGSPPPKLPTPSSMKRSRTSSSGSEPELRPVVKKLDQISGFENIIRDSKMGIKLPKVPDIIQPICDRAAESMLEPSISKELKPPDIIKPFNTSIIENIPLSQPLVNGIETDPTMISNLLKEVAPAVNHLADDIKLMEPSGYSVTQPAQSTVMPTVTAPAPTAVDGEKHKSEHHKSEKKKKKDKHKHKDKDKSKEEKKKKHKDKDKERHKIKTEKSNEPDGEAPLKITISKDKYQPPMVESSSSTSGTGIKVKISKDRLKTDTISEPPAQSALKIKISKDQIQYNSVVDSSTSSTNNSSSSSRKRDREKISPATATPATKVLKTNYNSSGGRQQESSRQNGRNSYNKVAQMGDGDASQLRLAESKYHSKGASKAS